MSLFFNGCATLKINERSLESQTEIRPGPKKLIKEFLTPDIELVEKNNIIGLSLTFKQFQTYSLEEIHTTTTARSLPQGDLASAALGDALIFGVASFGTVGMVNGKFSSMNQLFSSNGLSQFSSNELLLAGGITAGATAFDVLLSLIFSIPQSSDSLVQKEFDEEVKAATWLGQSAGPFKLTAKFKNTQAVIKQESRTLNEIFLPLNNNLSQLKKLNAVDLDISIKSAQGTHHLKTTLPDFGSRLAKLQDTIDGRESKDTFTLDTITAYRKFITIYPQNTRVTKAQNRISRLEAIAVDSYKQAFANAGKANFEKALSLLKQIPSDSAAYPQAEKKRQEWFQLYDQRQLVLYKQAFAKAEKAKFAEALALLKQISPDSTTYPQAEKKIQAWSQLYEQQQLALYKQAFAKAEKTKFADALSLLKQISPDSAVYPQAQQKFQAWSQLHEQRQLAEKNRIEQRRLAKERRHLDIDGSSGGLLCNDGTVSPSCTCGGSHRGCCSWHGGVAGCQN